MSDLHRLTNGRYTAYLSPAGTGYAAYGDIALTRWSGDTVEDRDAQVLYLRDLNAPGAAGEKAEPFWSLGRQPAGGGGHYAVRFRPDRAEIERICGGIELRMALYVSPDDPLELRRVTVINRNGRPRRLELTSYSELVLATLAAEAAHPAFSKLFVQTAWDAGRRAVTAMRRPRGSDDKAAGAVCWLVTAPGLDAAVTAESDRLKFLGRGRDTANPLAMASPAPLSGSAGNVLDPVFALRCQFELAPNEEANLAYGLAFIESREDADDIISRHTGLEQVDSVFKRAEVAYGGAAAAAGFLDGDTEDEPRYIPLIEAEPPPREPPAREPNTWPGTEDLQFDNGYGGFTNDACEYVIRVGPEHRPPLPWTHVVANENFGFLVSETGAGFTWSENSRLNRLTPWFNDPVTDPHGEALYIRDEDAGTFWSPQPGPAASGAACVARYGFGTCAWSQTSAELDQHVTAFVPRQGPIKVIRVKLRALDGRRRRLSVFAYFRLVLGDQSGTETGRIRTWRDEETGGIFAENTHASGDGGIAFAALAGNSAAPQSVSVTTERKAFIGRFGSPARPAAVMRMATLDGYTGTPESGCFALQVTLDVEAGGTAACDVLFGQAESEDEARLLLRRYQESRTVDAGFDSMQRYWRKLLTVIQIKTPLPALDVIANGWLLYQVLSCRLWARSAFYQSGGAFGFRDQLQDSLAFAAVRPELTRRQILLHAAHQFEEGDVLHWWHPPESRGIRTRFSDDLLWLPFVTASYIETVGTGGILDERAPFMTARNLGAGEDEAYLLPKATESTATIYEHCCRALDRSLTEGAHGLPLMGTGDWNDGMNRVGRGGRGESVWLGFFLYLILARFILICCQHGDGERAAAYERYRQRLENSLNGAGWDGAWYRRAYYDDGTALGSAGNDECQIDVLAQAWAVISGAAPKDRIERALDAAEARLVSDEAGMIRLLAPPFENTPHDPGYIKGYVAGVRENGGQYTHAAMWAIQALAEAGRVDRAAELLELLSPVSHASTRERADTYMVEPYVVAADVYGVEPHLGRGGWTWYTGAAGWMYQVIIRTLLGFRLRIDDIVLKPKLPSTWPGYELRFRCPDGHTVYELHVVRHNGGDGPELALTVDGRPMEAEGETARFKCQNDGRLHSVTVTVR